MSFKQYIVENYGRAALRFCGACLVLWVLFLRLVSEPIPKNEWLGSIFIVSSVALLFAAVGATVGAVVCFLNWLAEEPEQ